MPGVIGKTDIVRCDELGTSHGSAWAVAGGYQIGITKGGTRSVLAQNLSGFGASHLGRTIFGGRHANLWTCRHRWTFEGRVFVVTKSGRDEPNGGR